MSKRERMRAIERLECSKKQAYQYMTAIKQYLNENKWKEFKHDYENEYRRRKYVYEMLSHLDYKIIPNDDLNRLDEYYHNVCENCIIDR